MEEGRLVIDSQGKPVPPFLLEANEAVGINALAEARAMLSSENLRTVDDILDRDPSRADLLYMVVKLLLATGGDPVFAEAWCRRLVEADPCPLAWHFLALVCQAVPGQSEQALFYAEKAFRASPQTPAYAETYASCLAARGRVDDALALMQEEVRRESLSVDCLEGFLGRLLYLPETTRSHLYAGYRVLGAELSRGIVAHADYPNDPDPDRRLRVGFLSPDFRRNSTAIPFEVFLDGADRDRVALYAFGNVEQADLVTQRIQTKVDHYEDTRNQSPEEVARRVRACGIDVLVALGGYVHGHCMWVMAFRPAPVQADLGWVTTTGIQGIGHRFSDGIIDPPESLGGYVERTTYLAGGAACYIPPEQTPLVGSLPARTNGTVTFGSFNRSIKMTEAMVEAWSRILLNTPGTRLIVKSPSDDAGALERRLLPTFARAGIGADRIEFHGQKPYLEYLDLINRVDLTLDTHPFNGCVTTLESLWMGAPVLNLMGETYVSRVGLSILSRLGLEIFVAGSFEEYVAKACAFASQLDALEQIRRALRGRMLASPLCDPGRWAREVEAGLRTMWRRWCEGRVGRPESMSRGGGKGGR
jgi:predicted O-linked N-acetylglucosamine transferase (SPINDLY family)